MKCSLDISNFLEEICSLSHSHCFFRLVFCFLVFFCIVHLRRLSYLSLLFSGTLHSVGYIFSFIPCLSHLFFLQVFVKPPQTTTLPSCISFPLKWFWSLSPVLCSAAQLCPTLWDAMDCIHQDILSLELFRQEYWSGLPFPFPRHESKKWKWSCSVMSDS